MFTWKVEDMYLMNHRGHVFLGKYRPFPIESELSREEKIEFIDSQISGKMTYVLDLVKKFESEMPNMKRDQWGSVRTQTLIGWCKRNDPQKIVDTTYNYGKIRLSSCERYIQSFEHKGAYDTHEDFVDEVFYRLLKDLLRLEEAYFKTIDPYEIAKTKLRENYDRFRFSFGVPLCFCSDGEIRVNNQPIPIGWCNILNEQYDAVRQTFMKMEEEIAELIPFRKED